MKNIMWTYMDEQPHVLTKLLDSKDVAEVVSSIPLSKLENIVFVASGSSNNICRAAKGFIEKIAGTNVSVMYPFEFENDTRLLHKFPIMHSLIVGISQTGTSTGTYRSLVRAKGFNFETLTLTEQRETPVKEIGDHYLNFMCGAEICNAKTKGYSASLVLLHLIGIEIGVNRGMVDVHKKQVLIEELRESINEIPNVIAQTIAWIDRNQSWRCASSLMVIGHGDHYATAIEGALKLSETLCIPAVACDVDEYAHGYHRILEEDSYVILIEGEGYGKDKIQKTIEYVRQKTTNHLIIRTSMDESIPYDEIQVKCHHNINSTLTAVIVFQVLSIAIPELLGVDPNAEKNALYLKYLKTSINGDTISY